MKRNEAIKILCQEQLKTLTKSDRENILSSWWNIDQEDDEFHNLPLELQKEILHNDNVQVNIMDSKYDPLIIEALKHSLWGVRNEYIIKKIFCLLGKDIFIEDNPEDLFPCPCCQYKTLRTRGEYSICPICKWEDDGNDEKSLNKYSFPNHMTLSEAKKKFSESKDFYETEKFLR